MSVDRRSVGELLHAADVAAREALFDADAAHAAAHYAGWCELVDAAVDLWRVLPPRTYAPTVGWGGLVGREMDYIAEVVDRVGRVRAEGGWAASVADDGHLSAAADSLRRAAGLVGRVQRPAPATAAGQADVEAARTRTMGVLAYATHATRLSLQDLRRTRTGRPVGRQLMAGLDTVEALALAYQQPRFPHTLTGEHRGPVDPDRLAGSLARWDHTAHRVLVNSPRVGDMVLVASTQRAAATETGVVLRAAAEVGGLDAAGLQSRLQPALDRSAQAWGTLERQLRGLRGRTDQHHDPELARSGREVLAAFGEITGSGTGAATPGEVAARVDPAEVVRAVEMSLRWGSELAHATADAVATQPSLRAPARLLTPIARHLEAQLAGRRYDGQLGTVTTRDGAQSTGYLYGGGQTLPLLQAIPSRDGRSQWRGHAAADVAQVELLDQQPRTCTQRTAGPVISPAVSVEEARQAAPVDVNDAVARRDVDLPWQVRALLITTCTATTQATQRVASAAHTLTSPAPRPQPTPGLLAARDRRQSPAPPHPLAHPAVSPRP